MLSPKRFHHPLIFLLCLIVMSGCATRIGSGTADGSYLTINGEVINAYDRQHNEVVQAALDVLSAMEMPIRYKREIPNETIILSQTRGDLPLKLRFIREGRNLTVIKVRTGYIGFMDEAASIKMHTLITEELNHRTHPSPDTPVDLKETTVRKDVNPETIEPSPIVAAPAPIPASKAPRGPVPTETARSVYPPSGSVPERAALPVSEEKSSDPPVDLKETTVRKDVNPETIEPSPIVAAPAPIPASKAPRGPVPTETERLASPPSGSVPERAALPVSEDKPSDLPLSEPDITVYFEEDSNFPLPAEMAKLEQAAMQALANPQWHMALTGYAGRQENDGHAQMVSESRVLAVKFYLVGKGVDVKRIATIEHALRDSEKTTSAQRHRRVEIRFLLGP